MRSQVIQIRTWRIEAICHDVISSIFSNLGIDKNMPDIEWQIKRRVKEALEESKNNQQRNEN